MARPLRLERPGAIWHVTSRGNERRNIHRSDRDRLFFVELLGQVVELHHWILHAWVLMSAFCENLQALVNTKQRSREHPESQRIFVRPSFDAVVDLVARFFEQPIANLRQRSHRPIRKALAQLAWEEAGLTLAAIGNWMNLTERAVSHLVCRAKQLECSDHDYADRIRDIRQHLRGL